MARKAQFLCLSILISIARSHSLVADFGAIVHRREPDNPVKDGALSGPFFSLQVGTLATAFLLRQKRAPFCEGAKSAKRPRKMNRGHGKALTRVQIPMGALFLFMKSAYLRHGHLQSRWTHVQSALHFASDFAEGEVEVAAGNNERKSERFYFSQRKMKTSCAIAQLRFIFC
jgi:hypothetical protein